MFVRVRRGDDQRLSGGPGGDLCAVGELSESLEVEGERTEVELEERESRLAGVSKGGIGGREDGGGVWLRSEGRRDELEG